MQCKKLGRESLCTYANGPSGSPSAVSDGSERVQKRARFDISNNYNTWERAASANSHHSPREAYSVQNGFVYDRTTTEREQDPIVEGGAFSIASGKFSIIGDKSRYIGLGDWMALVDQV